MSRISTLLRTCGRGPTPTILAIAIASAAAFGLGLLASTTAGDRGATVRPVQEGMDQEEMMKAWMQAGEPVEQHKELQAFVGEWDAKLEGLIPAMEFENTGTATYESIMGGRFIRMDFHSDVMGTPMHGISISGYHKPLDRFESIWIDGTATAIAYFTGEKTDTGWVYEGDETDPMMKVTIRVRDTIDMHGKDKFVFTRHYPAEAAAAMGAQVEEGEDWIAGFRITYTRKQAGGDNGNGLGGGNARPAPEGEPQVGFDHPDIRFNF